MSTLTDLFSDIADAIRAKDGSSSTIVASDFPAAIAAIPSGADEYEFKQSIAPTHWTAVTSGTDYTVTDNYGTWEIKADSYDGDRYIRKAFDGRYEADNSENPTVWVSSEAPRGTPINAELDFPVLIKPKEVVFKPVSKMYDTVANIYFSQTTNGNDWELLGSVTDGEEEYITVPISTTNFYRRMRISTIVGSSPYHSAMAGYFDIEITKGYWKEVLI